MTLYRNENQQEDCQSTADRVRTHFISCDLDLDPMTLTSRSKRCTCAPKKNILGQSF